MRNCALLITFLVAIIHISCKERKPPNLYSSHVKITSEEASSCFVYNIKRDNGKHEIYAEFVFPYRWERFEPIFKAYQFESDNGNMNRLARLIIKDALNKEYASSNFAPLNEGEIKIKNLNKEDADAIQEVLCRVTADTALFRKYVSFLAQ